jgi:uncharacterized protein
MKAPFLVNIAAMRPATGGRHHVTRTGRLDGLAITSSSVAADADVMVDVDLEVVDGGVVATGSVSSRWVGECRRCLRPVSGELRAEVREVFERAPRLREGVLDEADEAETYPLTGDTLDLAPLARDALLLELPLAPLCRDDCAGLCPTCGADLTEHPCDCSQQSINPVWAALDGLRLPPPEGGVPAGAGGGVPAGAGGAEDPGDAGDELPPDSA